MANPPQPDKDIEELAKITIAIGRPAKNIEQYVELGSEKAAEIIAKLRTLGWEKVDREATPDKVIEKVARMLYSVAVWEAENSGRILTPYEELESLEQKWWNGRANILLNKIGYRSPSEVKAAFEGGFDAGVSKEQEDNRAIERDAVERVFNELEKANIFTVYPKSGICIEEPRYQALKSELLGEQGK
jgi:hypothetical protein